VADPRSFLFTLDPARRPAPVRLAEKLAPDIGWYNANRASVRAVHPVEGIEGIVVHATAGATAGGALAWWKMPAGRASAHWIIPGEQEAAHGRHVIAAVYEALAAWHVRPECRHPDIADGRGGMNQWTLGIEIVNTQSREVPDPFSDWQVEACAGIIRHAWARYPNLRWVFSHAAVDPARRSDPGANFPWARLEALVKGRRPGGAMLADVALIDEGALACCE
jgi:N-acetyl-anhydromuramyl-L-alanine amidase AmpD